MTTRTVSAVASFKGRRFCRPSAPSIGDFSPTSATRHESVSTTSNRLSLGSHARGCPRACVSASGQAPSAARRDLRPPSTEWRCPLQGHTSRASWVRGQIDVKRRTGLLPWRLLAAEALPQPEFCSDTFCRRLVAAPAGEADMPGRFRVPLTNPPGYEAGPSFPDRPRWNPREPAFAKLALPENPAFAGPFRDQGRLPPISAKRMSDPPHPRCLSSRGEPGHR